MRAAAARARDLYGLAADRQWPSIQSPEKADKPIDVIFVLIDSEADPQHIAANVGDAVLNLEVGIPALGVGASEGEEARVRAAFERIEQFRLTERSVADRVEETLLQTRGMGRDSCRRQFVLGQHAPDGS